MPRLADLFRAHYLADGVDFDSIRVHHSDTPGADGDLACRALGARAFTVGTDIYFAAGGFRPHTRDGLWLLAHEVAHVVQQCAGLVGAPRPGAGSALTVLPAETAEERAADRAADALIAGRHVTFGASDLGAGVGAGADRRPVLQRYMAWEHSMLGDLDPAQVRAAADGDAGPVADYRDLLAELGRAPRQADEKRLRAAHPAVDPVRLRGSGLVVTLGELNVLPDYLGRPEDIESAPLSFVGPLIQSVRSWSIAELARPAGVRSVLGPWPAALPRLLPGSLRYPLLGPLAETAEIAAVSALGRRHGFESATRYSAVLARNSGHFAPFSWYRWLSFHHAARELIARSAAETGTEQEALRLRARTWAGYADHFLQDSFAAGHLINKTLVIQWYIEWLAASGVSYPGRDVLDALTVARQPLLHGPGYYDRAAARARALAGGTAAPEPARDAQDVADAGTPEERIAASGVVGDSDAERRAAYAAYLAMLGSGTVQLAVKVAHEYLNAHSLVVSAGPAARASGSTGTTPCWPARPGRCRRRRRPPRPAGRSRSCCGTARPRWTAGISSTASPTTWSTAADCSRFRNGTARGFGPYASSSSNGARRGRSAASCRARSGSGCCPPATRWSETGERGFAPGVSAPDPDAGPCRAQPGPRCCQPVNRSTSPLGRSPIPWAETAYPPASASPYRAPAARAIRANLLCRGSIAYAVAVMRLISASTGNRCSHARRSWVGSHSSAHSRRRTHSSRYAYRSCGLAASISTAR